MKFLALFSLFFLSIFSFPAFSQEATPPTTEQCLACHGPFANLVNKNIKVPADPNPVNPHVFVPHDQKEKFYDCIACHTPHAMPAPKGFKDKTAHIEPCYSCHHGEQIQKCSQCHKE